MEKTEEMRNLEEMENTLKGMIQNKVPFPKKIEAVKKVETTSDRIADITKKKISAMTSYQRKARKKTMNTKTTRQKQTIFDMFKDRRSPIYGLTKQEVLADFLNKSLSDLFRLTKDERDREWKKFKKRSKGLRNDEMIGIVSRYLSAGTVLRDIPNGHWGDRPLKIKQHIYFRCFEMLDASSFRSEMDKVITGVDEAGDLMIKLSEEQTKNKQVIEVMNGNGGQKHEN